MSENHNYYAVITANILMDKRLSSTQKLLVALINNLSNQRGYCFASNKYLAESLDISSVTVQQNIAYLESLKIVNRVMKLDAVGNIEYRVLTVIDPILNSTTPHIESNTTPHIESNTIITKSINNKETKEVYMSFLHEINHRMGRNYKGSDKVERQFHARIKEGRTLLDFVTAITNAMNIQWHKDNKYEYLTPEFFTRADKLDKFLNMAPVIAPKTYSQW